MNGLSMKRGVPDHIAEYFVVCGLSETPTPFDVSEILINGEEIVLSESKCLDFSRYTTPIVDIKLVNLSRKEKPPDGYRLINKSIGGLSGCFLQSRSGDNLCICYRRGYDISPIGDIALVDTHQKLKPNSCNIERTIDEHPALIMKKRLFPTSDMYLCYSRLPKNYRVDDLALTDICIIFKKKGECCPLGYMELSQKLIYSFIGDDMHICYKKSFAKRYIATYQPEVLMWYRVPSIPSSLPMMIGEIADEPIFNSVDIVTLSNFCLPWGATIESWSVDQNPPGSVFFTFVVTNAAYQKFHGSALTFYEPYDVSRLDRDRCYRLNVDPELVQMEETELKAKIENEGRRRPAAVVTEAETELFTPEELVSIEQRQGAFAASRIGDRVLGVTKTLCFVSRFNFGDSLKPLLEFLNSRCFISKAQPISLERYLAFMLCEIPFPDHRSSSVIVNLGDHHMRLQAPYINYLSNSSGEPYADLLYRLGSELILQLVVQILTEQKLLFVSVMPDLLVSTIQQLTTLIHPLRWVLVYIPLIHMRCIHVIQSPSPYLIGVDSRFFEFFQLPPTEADISVVDLDTRLFRPAAAFADARTVLPRAPQKRLRAALMRNQVRLDEIALQRQKDTQWGVHAQEKYKDQMSLVGSDIRRACYTFMVELLQDYRGYLLPITSKDKSLLFDSEGFVKHTADRNSHLFYETLVGTQLWADFVRDLNCISERTSELEAFDNAISQLNGSSIHAKAKSGGSRGSSSSGGRIGGGGDKCETHSQLSSGSGGDANSAASAPLDGASAITRGSLSGTDNSSTKGCLLPFSECPRTVDAPGLLELDPLCMDLPLTSFTWTRMGHFPETINTALLDELCARVRRTTAVTSAAATLSSGVAMSKIEEGSEGAVFRFVDDADVASGEEDDFRPPPHCLPQPLPFVRGNGVSEALGVVQLNFLLKRTLQETTDCLIAATKRRNAGGTAWAEQLLSEVYSLWFLLLPAFIASLQQHYSDNGGDDDVAGVCLEARHFLFHVVGVFLRLWDSPLQPVDQVYVRVLISLLYEYGTSDQGVINFWSSRSLNAPSYAMANQLQRDLGHKLTAVGVAAESSINASPTETKEAIEPQNLASQATSTPNRVCDASSRRQESRRSLSAEGVGSHSRNSSNLNLSNSQIIESMDKISITVVGNGGTDIQSQSFLSEPVSSKKGWKSLAQASMRKLASFKVEYVNPDVITLEQSPSQHVRSRSVSSSATKPIGYLSLFGQPGSSTRLPRNMRPWAVTSTSQSVSSIAGAAPKITADEEVLPQGGETVQTSLHSSLSSSWLQMLQRHLPASTLSPAPSRRLDIFDTPQGSIASIDGGVIGTAVTTTSSTSLFDSQLSVLSYQPPSWYTIAGPLVVGPVGDRVCLVNPLVMEPPCLSPQFSAPVQRRRPRFSSLAVARREGSLKYSPSASFPLLHSALEDSVDAHAHSKPPKSSKSPPPLLKPTLTSTSKSGVRTWAASPVQEIRVIFTTCTPCGSCSHLLYDEEIMAMWVATGSPSHSGLSCSHCFQPLVPRLTVRTIAILESTSLINATTPISHGLIEQSVPYLSPLVLRRQLEAVINGGSGDKRSCSDIMAAQALSSASLLSHRRGRVLLWNLVYLLHRAGLPTHLLDAFPAWLMDAQTEARRLGGARRVLLGGSLTVARALSEVVLSPKLPVCLVARWDAFPRKTATGKEVPLLHRLWGSTYSACCMSPSGSVADFATSCGGGAREQEPQECALVEIVRMAGDALAYKNVGAAVHALRSLKRAATHSVHRELLLLYARIHGTSWQQINNFDAGYIAYLCEELQRTGAGVQQQDLLQRWRANNELPPSATVLACRCIFRSLVLT